LLKSLLRRATAFQYVAIVAASAAALLR
jgi:hypothetical protein